MSEASAVATTDLPLDVLASTIKARVEVGDRTAEKAADHYRAAGLLLVEAKSRIAKEGGNFADFIYDCGVGRSRAYELIGIANGTKTLAGIRASTAERVARHEKKKKEERPLANGLPDQDSVPLAEADWLRSELERLQAEIERLAEENTALKDRVEVSALEITCLRAENERLRSDEGSGPDWFAASDSGRSADEIIRTEFSIELAQTLAFEGLGFENEPEANNVLERRLTSVDIQAAGALLGQSAARNVIKKIRERKKANRQTPDKAALAALRKRAQALGYKTIHRRNGEYFLINAEGNPEAGGSDLGALSWMISEHEDTKTALDAGGVVLYRTTCGIPISAVDKNGDVGLDDPRVVQILTEQAQAA